MNYSCIELFPTLLMKFDDIIFSEELSNIFRAIKNENAQRDQSLINGKSGFDNNEDILLKLNIKERFQEAVNIYSIQHKLPNIFIANSWFSIQDIGGMLKEHDHPESIISGVFYINVNEDSNPLVFKNPNNIISYTYGSPMVYPERSKYNTDVVYIQPKNGELILFPSWLKHGCDYIQNQYKDRTVISFNTSLTDKCSRVFLQQ